MPMTLRGSCLCGGVRYAVEGPLLAVARCHCEQCRKASGAEFATNGSVPKECFSLESGEELLAEYEWRPGQARVFCGRCGSPIMKRAADKPDHVRIRLGCLDSENDQSPLLHVWVSEKPAWASSDDDLPQFETVPDSAKQK